MRDKLAAPIRSLFEVVKSLVRKKPGGRKRRKTSNQAGRVHYVASEVSLVYALRCIDENCSNVTDAYTACLVDVRDGNEVFGTVRNAERHYKKHHSVEISAGDGGSIEDNGIDANAEPPATPQGHGTTALRRSPRTSPSECVLFISVSYVRATQFTASVHLQDRHACSWRRISLCT